MYFFNMKSKVIVISIFERMLCLLKVFKTMHAYLAFYFFFLIILSCVCFWKYCEIKDSKHVKKIYDKESSMLFKRIVLD